MIEKHMAEQHFDFISDRDKLFIIEFTKALDRMGYTYGGEIGSLATVGENICLFTEKLM